MRSSKLLVKWNGQHHDPAGVNRLWHIYILNPASVGTTINIGPSFLQKTQCAWRFAVDCIGNETDGGLWTLAACFFQSGLCITDKNEGNGCSNDLYFKIDEHMCLHLLNVTYPTVLSIKKHLLKIILVSFLTALLSFTFVRLLHRTYGYALDHFRASLNTICLHWCNFNLHYYIKSN